MINSVKSLQEVNLQLGVGKNIVPQSNFRQLPARQTSRRAGDGTDGAAALGKEIGSVAGIFRIARRQTGKTGRFRYKQKSEKGSVQANNL